MKNNIPRIISIVEAKPYSLLLRFENDELRLMKFSKKELSSTDLQIKLLDKEVFIKASLTDKGTIAWKDITYINALVSKIISSSTLYNFITTVLLFKKTL